MYYEIVPMDRSHIPQIAALERECFSDPWSENLLGDALFDPQASFLVAEDGEEGNILGYAGLHAVLDEGYIDNIAVVPDARRHGVASALLDVFCRFGAANLAFLTLEVRQSNAAAIALYEKFGFQKMGVCPNAYRLKDGTYRDEIQMVRMLGKAAPQELEFCSTDFLESDEIKLVLERTAGEDKEKGYLPCYYFAICSKNGQKMGTCDLRVGHNENTLYGGNIGYAIEEPYRGHYYAGKACLLLFRLAKKHQMEYVTITCSPENTASRKTCEYAGGVFQGIFPLPEWNEMYQMGSREKCRYHVALKTP